MALSNATSMDEKWRQLGLHVMHDAPLSQQDFMQNYECMKNDLMVAKNFYVAQQSVARLAKADCFINLDANCDATGPHAIHKRFQDLYKAAKRWSPMHIQEILELSTVCEWPVEVEHPTYGHRNSNWNKKYELWDRAPMVFKVTTKDSTANSAAMRKKLPEYQIRILALDKADVEGHVVEVTVTSTLQTTPENVFTANWQGSRIGKPGGSLVPEKKSGDAKRGRNGSVDKDKKVSGGDAAMHTVTWKAQKTSGYDAILFPNEKCKYEYKMDEVNPTFCIRLGQMYFYPTENCGANKYQISSEMTINIDDTTYHIGHDPLNPYRAKPIISLPFELSRNMSQHDTGHFLKFAWNILLQVNKSFGGLDPESTEISWEYIREWASGMMAMKNDYFVRTLDDSELRSFQRMLFIRRIVECTESRPDNGLSEVENWKELEREMFHRVSTNEENYQNAEAFKAHMICQIRRMHIKNSFMVRESDFTQHTWYIDAERNLCHELDFSPSIWLLNAAAIVADSNKKMHDQPEIATKMFNERVLVMRSADAGQKIMKIVNVKKQTPAILLRIDESDLGTLCVGFSGNSNGTSLLEKNPHYGRVTIDVLHGRKFYEVKESANGSSAAVQDRKKRKRIYGLKAFFKTGYPSNYRKIIQVCKKESSDNDGYLIHIFEDTRSDARFLYKNVTVAPSEAGEIDPIVGPFSHNIARYNEDTDSVGELSEIASHMSLGRPELPKRGKVYPQRPVPQSESRQHYDNMSTTERFDMSPSVVSQTSPYQGTSMDMDSVPGETTPHASPPPYANGGFPAIQTTQPSPYVHTSPPMRFEAQQTFRQPLQQPQFLVDNRIYPGQTLQYYAPESAQMAHMASFQQPHAQHLTMFAPNTLGNGDSSPNYIPNSEVHLNLTGQSNAHTDNMAYTNGGYAESVFGHP